MPNFPGSGFDAVAPVYDKLAKLVFGNALEKAQLATLEAVPDGASVLIVGGGSGYILQQVLLRCNCRQVLYLEASEKMLELTARKLARLPALETKTELRMGSEKDLRPGETFDIIITNFVLDLFAESRLLQLTADLENRLNPDGTWLVTDFRFIAGKQQPYWQKALLQTMYLFFKITCRIEARTLPDWHKALRRPGLTKIKSCLFYNQMIEAAVYRKEPVKAAGPEA